MEEQFLISFGFHVKSLRQHLDLSQEQLALIANLDRTYISGIERGKRNISLLNIVKLANALGVEKSKLLEFSVSEELDNE